MNHVSLGSRGMSMCVCVCVYILLVRSWSTIKRCSKGSNRLTLIDFDVFRFHSLCRKCHCDVFSLFWFRPNLIPSIVMHTHIHTYTRIHVNWKLFVWDFSFIHVSCLTSMVSLSIKNPLSEHYEFEMSLAYSRWVSLLFLMKSTKENREGGKTDSVMRITTIIVSAVHPPLCVFCWVCHVRLR